MLIRLSSGWFRSLISSQEMSVVILNRCSSIGRIPLTRIDVPMPVAIAAKLCSPIHRQSVWLGDSQITGPICPNAAARTQVAMPT